MGRESLEGGHTVEQEYSKEKNEMEHGRTHDNTPAFSSSVRRSSCLSVVSHGLVVGPITPLAGPLRSSRHCV